MFNKKQGVEKSFLFAMIGMMLIAGIFVAGVSAGSISLNVSTATTNSGDTITIPVIIHDAKDIAGFTVDVSNTVPGAIVTIDKKSKPLGFGTCMFNSGENNDVQRVIWFNSEGFTADNQEIFSIQVKVVSSDVTEVPITITPVTIVSSASEFLTSDYPVVEIDSFPISGSTTGKVLYGGKSVPETMSQVTTSSSTFPKTTDGKDSDNTQTPKVTSSLTPTSVLNTNGKEQNSVQSTASQTAGLSTPQSSSESTNPTSTQSSPLGIFPLMALGFAGILLLLKKK